MDKLSTEDVLSLEAYDDKRKQFKEQAFATKKLRRIPLGDNITFLFENRFTIWYQLQEILRAEKIFTKPEIVEELESYNMLIADKFELKATMLIEYEDVEVRKEKLKTLREIEHQLYLQFADEQVMAIADEDLERSNDEKTSAVHFLRFPFTEQQYQKFMQTDSVMIGSHHQHMSLKSILSDASKKALDEDLQVS